MHPRLVGIAIAASSLLPAQAQIVHADFDTSVFADLVSMGGPNLLLAIKTTVPAAVVATRVEVFTGEGAGANSIALWSHDVGLDRPLAALGSGQWQMGFTNGWQGAPLAAPVPLAANDVVWIVWGCQNGAQASVQGNGAGAQPYRGSFDGGTTWSGPFQTEQWKFRIWSGPAAHFEVYGTGCAGTGGVPRLAWIGAPLAGTTFAIDLARGPAASVALLAIGDSDTTFGAVPLPWSMAPFGAPACSLWTSWVTAVATPVDVVGQALVPLTVPAAPGLAGLRFFCQWTCFDPAANAFGFTFSNAGVATVGS
jgi:hypothetical protein